MRIVTVNVTDAKSATSLIHSTSYGLNQETMQTWMRQISTAMSSCAGDPGVISCTVAASATFLIISQACRATEVFGGREPWHTGLWDVR